ncbi:MAG: hypothetical protein IAE89_15960 [Anaerolineae bacterium]|nr:hypothetical protein [Anaerolineae bacterium]
MGRVINTDSTGKQRNQQMRLAAEMLRRLSVKAGLDDEARDMAATLIFALRKVDEGIESSASVWDNRDYYMKAEELRQRWAWAGRIADELQAMIIQDRWADLPALLAKLFPKVSDITVVKFTSKEADWAGNYNRLIAEQSPR